MRSHIKKDATVRLKRARGHLDHVIIMVETGEYCIDILQQSLAVQSALRAVDSLVLKGHLEEHVHKAMHAKNKEKSIQEIIAVFKKSRGVK